MIGTILVLFIVLPLVVRSVDDETIQRLPTDSPNNHPFFEDLKLDVEHSLTVNNHGDYFYVIRMPSPNQPLFLTFTPCQKPVHWQIRIPNHFATQPNIHPRTDHLRHVLHLRIPPLIELPEESQQKDKLVLLAGEENEKRMDFYASSIEAEYVLLNVWSTGNTMLKVFATTTKSKRDAIYPTLPENATVDYSLSTKDNQTFEVELNWLLPEQLLNVKDDSKHRFCVLVSEKQPHHAICDEPNDVDVDSIHCTKKTSMRIPNLRPNHRYYATVHLHNQKSGGSSAYHPIEFRTPESNKKTSDVMEAKGSANRIHKSQKLPDGVLMKHSVAQPKDNANVYVYEPAANFQANGKILLVVYACNGYIRVAINKNDMVEKKRLYWSSSVCNRRTQRTPASECY
ncbi:hypothetical protein M3Y94_00261900 [Aphelenchoides besseyi]|nr:hypothetical protein M3Y94_00261900 [Aphelenchoides besseyi]